MSFRCDAYARPFSTRNLLFLFAADIQNIIREPKVCLCQLLELMKLHDQRPRPLGKPLSSYTAMKSAAAVTLDLRHGKTTSRRSDRCFKTQIVLTGLPLHHMSCKVCETLREIAMIGLY